MNKLIAVGIKKAGSKVIAWVYDYDAFQAENKKGTQQKADGQTLSAPKPQINLSLVG